MNIPYEALVVVSQVIPILLLASYFDRDVLNKISTYNKRTKYGWVATIYLVVIGELIALIGVISGEALVGWQGFTVMLALVLALFNLLNIAGWRVLGLDPVSGMSKKKKK